MIRNDDIPVLACFDTGRQYTAWCPWCKTWHFHGRGPGLRTEHCSNESSPFIKTGYNLKLAALPNGVTEILVKDYLSKLTASELFELFEECGAAVAPGPRSHELLTKVTLNAHELLTNVDLKADKK